MERTIKITGRAVKKVKADLVSLNINVSTKDVSQTVALDAARKKVKLLNEKIENLGFKIEDLKLESYDVSPEYQWIKEKREFVGYNVNYSFNFEFNLDSNNLVKVLSDLTCQELSATVNTSFKVKDEDKVKTEILQQLTLDAEQKAKILTEAAGVTLGDIISIDYNFDTVNYYSNTQFRMAKAMNYEASDGNEVLTPQEVQIDDSALFVFEIK